MYTRMQWYHRWWVQILLGAGALLVLFLFAVVFAIFFGYLLITVTSTVIGS